VDGIDQLIARWTWESVERPGGGHRVTKARDAARRAAFAQAVDDLRAAAASGSLPVELQELVTRWQANPTFAAAVAGEFAPLLDAARLEQEHTLGTAIGYARAAAELAAILPHHAG
jgi:hypothetical protein